MGMMDRAMLAADAYVYGYPLVFSIEQIERLCTTGIGALPKTEINAFGHSDTLSDANTTFVGVNNDTIYSCAVLDVSEGPLVLHVPDTKGRYYVFQFVDVWSNNFAYVGRRANGTKAADYLLTPPEWEGEIPAGLTEIRLPMDIAVIVGRWACEGQADIPHVKALQTRVSLRPVSTDAVPAGLPAYQSTLPDDLLFFEKLRTYMAAYPAPPHYAQAAADFGPLGLLFNTPLVPDKALAEDIRQGAMLGTARIKQMMQGDTADSGWQMNLHTFDYNMDFFGPGTVQDPAWIMDDVDEAIPLRAAAAMAGLWGNHGYEAGYASAWADANGETLHGGNTYTIHFDELPPVDAFWSLTMHDVPDYYLVDNPIGRYSIGDRMPGIVYAGDGSLTLTLSSSPPDHERERANWLPAPDADFRLILRMYQPPNSILDGTYVLPAIKKVS